MPDDRSPSSLGLESLPTAANLAFVEELYADFCRDPESVDPQWQSFFQQMKANAEPGLNGRVGPSFTPRSNFNPAGSAAPQRPNGKAPAYDEANSTSMQHRVDKLIRNFRVRGHVNANLDPLGFKHPVPREMNPAFYSFTEADMDRPFATDWLGDYRRMTLREIIEHLGNTYCRYIGAQFMHIDDFEVRRWLQRRMEATQNRTELSRDEQLRILTRLTDAVILEQFIQKKFIGAKSFSLEGAESLIPLLDMLIEKAGEQEIAEIVIGMAHRGRLNVLANILGKSPKNIFREFEDVDPEMHIGGGDVKYHLGHSGDWKCVNGNNVHLSLCFNPSHLEFVNPVALGRMRAKQDKSGRPTRGEGGFVLLIHGDAAFAGEGIVQETLNLSELEGYSTGGTIHVVINNQIGFTTGPEEGRSSNYATDVAKMLQIPIFHVNGEAPEAVAQVVRLAMDFRYEFKRDVVIDMYCYRRRGHNEGDEPRFTQPRMYRAIDKRVDVRQGYVDHLLELGNGVTRDEADAIVEARTAHLEQELQVARSDEYTPPTIEYTKHWSTFHGGPDTDVPDVDTGVEQDRLTALLRKLTELPEDFEPLRQIQRIYKGRLEMAEGKRPLDWAAAEALAFATLATDGHRIRISGQDSQRGTFSHRHAVLHEATGGHVYEPFNNLAEKQGYVEIHNSPLSEAGVLGFEYGYSLDIPSALIVWEAQFGDFVNAAQVIIDQFISSAEDKWNRLSGLVMLLPHGFEGQGPEHSSARLERFLTQCAEDNMQVCYPSTPAQIFHLLRRQVKRPWRKPLIVMSPKSLLRHPKCVSSLADLATGRYQRVIPDAEADPKKVKRILVCAGKVYYDLLAKREEDKRDDVAIIRLEQYYPFPDTQLHKALEPYSTDVPAYFVQEEPENMGAWRFVEHQLHCGRLSKHDWESVTRPESASPATGSKQAHELEQKRLLAEAFGDD